MSVVPLFDANNSSEEKEMYETLANAVEGKRIFIPPSSNLYAVSKPS